ncbi:MAG: LPS-assembly protein LptD [Candidatus Omnitrophica bacterium]|nr:LPS-assembly protein LptD [Candidatus Omnitrophota bacterium]
MINKNIIFFGILFLLTTQSGWASVGKQPITVNGDTVEFKSEGREVLAEGNVEIIYQESKITCDKIRVFMDEKIAIADGHVKFTKQTGEQLTGETIVYDFGEQSGTLINSSVAMAPYYGRTDVMEKLSDTEFLLNNAELSTCDLPHPHYKLKVREADMKPGKSLTAKGIKVSILDVPIMYLPQYSQELTDKRPRLMFTPGHRKNLGTYVLGSWRYYLNQNARGLLHLDWYQEKGWAEGIDLNYNTKLFGEGNVKYYRIDQEDTREEVTESLRERDERSRLELRHRWNITDRDHAVLEFFKASDVDFRKDYFFREYEKEVAPRSFFLYSHVYENATLSFLGQPRVNDFESVVEKVPELKLETVNQKIGSAPLYYKSTTSMAHLMNTPAGSSVTADISRADTSNQLTYLFRFFSVDFSPFVGHRDTFYTHGLDSDEDLVRTMFFSGIDMSTKFFRLFDFQTDFMNLDIHNIRHVVTPSVQYRYQHEPSVNKSRLTQLDEVDALDRQNMVTLSLENKLQTKRSGQSVDLVTLILSSDYNLKHAASLDSGFQNFRYDLEFKPYSWWELDSDAEYDTQLQFFRTVNVDYWMNIGKSATTLGYRFKHDESSQMTAGFTCPLNPFWKIGIYERFEFKTGELVEHEYRLERDMHCWIMEFIINQRETEGITFMLAFKLKAFPDIGINAEKTFAPPRTELR